MTREGALEPEQPAREEDEALLSGFEEGLSLLRAGRRRDAPPVDLRQLEEGPEPPALSLEDSGEGAPLAAVLRAEHWSHTLARLRRLGALVAWVGARLSSQPDRVQTLFDLSAWVPFSDALNEIAVLEPLVDELRVQLRPLVLHEALSPEAEALLELVPAESEPPQLASRRWERLSLSLRSLGENLEQVWVDLVGEEEARCLLPEREGRAGLQARLSELRERLLRVRVRVKGCAELTLLDTQRREPTPPERTSAPWLAVRAPAADQWSQLLGSIRSLRRTVRRLEIQTAGARQTIFDRAAAQDDLDDALASLDVVRPLVEEVRLALLGQEQELVLFRREESDSIPFLPTGADEPAGEGADEWERALASLRQLRPFLREVWVSWSALDDPSPLLRARGMAPLLESFERRRAARLAVELVGADDPVILFERETSPSGMGQVQDEATLAWEELPLTLADLEPLLESVVVYGRGDTRKELSPRLGREALWERLRAARAVGLERVEAQLRGLGARVLFRSPSREERAALRLRRSLARATGPLTAELHLPPGRRVELPPDPARAAATLHDLLPVLALVRDARGELIFEQAADERHEVAVLLPSSSEPPDVRIDLSADADFVRLRRALGNVAPTAKSVLATIGDEEQRLDLDLAEDVLAKRWAEVRRVAVVLPNLQTPLLLLERTTSSPLWERWREVQASLERLAAQVKSLDVQLEGGTPARWRAGGGYPYARFLEDLRAHRAEVLSVRARLRGSPHDLVLFSLLDEDGPPQLRTPRHGAGHSTSAAWDPIRAAIAHMGPLIQTLEVRLKTNDYRAVYARGGDLEAALGSLDEARSELESIRVGFRPLCLFERSRPSESVSLRPPSV